MFKTILSTGHNATHKTLEEANAWISQEVANNSWGKPDRWENETDGTHTNTREGTTPEGEAYIEYFFPCEYTYETVDLSNDPEFLLEQVIKARTAEYPSIQECVEALMEKEAGDSTKLDELKIKRDNIKTKYPKPE